jgi:hypothetical protein
MRPLAARPRRRPLALALAGLIATGAVAASFALLAINVGAGLNSALVDAAPATGTSGVTATAGGSDRQSQGTTATASDSGEATPTPAAASPTTATASASLSASPTPQPSPSVNEYLVGGGSEPSMAADPAHPGVVAVASESTYSINGQPACTRQVVRVSMDGGLTWTSAANPWGIACEDIHAVVAWGPGSRLWAGDAMGLGVGVLMSVTHSDDLGKTWSRPYIEHFNPPWIGCFPSLTVDNWPGSPNFGTVYVAYNWLASQYGPGVSVMASRDGSTWAHSEVPLDPASPGYPYSWRIGYRIEAAPDGTARVAFYQSNLQKWNSANVLYQGKGLNIGRMGFETAVVHFDGTALSIDPPVPAARVDHTEAEWQSQMAVDGQGRTWLAIENRGRVTLGPLDGSWREISVPGKYSFKPSIAISGRVIFVGWHAQDSSGQVWTYYTISYDGGETFRPPALVTGASWNPGSTNAINGVGLRENADFDNGIVYYAYGDARSGLNVYLAVIRP